MAKIVTLKDHKTNEFAYPQTRSEAVYMNNGTTLEQFKSSVTAQFANYPNVTVTGTVTNLPDNEDIRETEQHTLQLADRNNIEGMGYKILRKNKSFRQQVDASYEGTPNTVYEIRYDFILTDNVTVPSNCVLMFNGGSIKNASGNSYKVTGTNTTINTDVSYNILGNTLGGGFNLPFVDVRWFGGISDYNEGTGTGTDNAPAFEEAINVLGEYYNGLHIRLIGQYYIGTNITTIYNLNIWGSHCYSRNLLSAEDVSSVSSPSLIAVGPCVAFTMAGKGGVNYAGMKEATFSIKNIKVVGTDDTSSTFIYYTASGAPARPSVIEEVECMKLFRFIELYQSNPDTMLAYLTISRCQAWHNKKFIYTHADASTGSTRTVSALIIENSVIEQNGATCIHLEKAWANVIIRNNLLEDQEAPIYITGVANVEINHNYFEGNTGTVVSVRGSASFTKNLLKFENNFCEPQGGSSPNIKVSFRYTKVKASADFNYFTGDSVFSEAAVIGRPVKFLLSWIPNYCMFDSFRVGSGYIIARNQEFNLISDDGYIGYDSLGSHGNTLKSIHCDSADDHKFFVFNAAKPGSALLEGQTEMYYDANPAYVTVIRLKPVGAGNPSLYLGTDKYDSTPSNVLAPERIVCGLHQITKDAELLNLTIPSVNTGFVNSTAPTFTSIPTGFSYYNTTSGKPIYWNGSEWKDAAGNTIA